MNDSDQPPLIVSPFLNAGVPAGLWRRILAFFLDQIILLPWYLLLGFSIQISMEWRNVLPMVLAMLVVWPLQVGFTVWYGGTVGKIVLGIQVVRLDGQRLSWGESWNRMALFYVSMLLGILSQGHVLASAPIGIQMQEFFKLVAEDTSFWAWTSNVAMLLVWVSAAQVVFRGDNRGLHDVWAETVVVRRPQPSVGTVAKP